MENNIRISGIGFIGWLQIAFIVLKLTGVISWSWLWVLAPTWIDFIIMAIILIILIVIYVTKENRIWEKNKK